MSLSVLWKAGAASWKTRRWRWITKPSPAYCRAAAPSCAPREPTHPSAKAAWRAAWRPCKHNNLDALIAIGGDDTNSVAQKLFEQGIKVVGVPKTIDNDLSGTDFCFGFDTAVNTAMEAIDRVHTTAEAHQRVMVVEVMGRDAGWIAMYSGIAGGADVILIPERPFDIEEVAERIRLRHARGRYFSIIVVAEGAKFASDVDPSQGAPVVTEMGKDEFGHVRLGGVGQILAREVERRTGLETRYVVLGHIQRGGSPSAFDRVLASRYGIGAIDMVHRGEFGCMVALRGNDIVSVPLTEAINKNRSARPRADRCGAWSERAAQERQEVTRISNRGAGRPACAAFVCPSCIEPRSSRLMSTFNFAGTGDARCKPESWFSPL